MVNDFLEIGSQLGTIWMWDINRWILAIRHDKICNWHDSRGCTIKDIFTLIGSYHREVIKAV